ncbi:ATP-binding protein [Martelella soudanensis]|uniref:ATP-binding protein n=1 Tax=Martelella sp. NC18 TaxID=2740297 RepID=UPI0015DDAF0F|nr:winged helix-turn-helix domain-containing protein [Martelella sp. NC18]
MSTSSRSTFSAGKGSSTVSFGRFRLDPARRLLLKEGEDIRIGSRALDLLIALVERAGDVVSRHELIDIVWQDTVVEEATVRVHISALRRALDDGRNGARYIVNIAGRGYSFVAAVTHDVPAAPPAQRRLAGQAPTLYRSIIGRERVIGSLSELLLERRFVSIVGTGGIGKTTVAAAVAERLKPEFDGQNVVFVDFGAIADPALVPDAVISSVGCTLAGNAPVDELLAFIANLHMLIIFDSCEHLLEATAFLAGQMFKRAPNIHLLVTSRESLRIEGETVHLLSTLACPVNDAPTAAEAMASPAVQLFMDRAISSGLHEPLTDSDAPIVSDICRRTDGIALAIELAASRAGHTGYVALPTFWLRTSNCAWRACAMSFRDTGRLKRCSTGVSGCSAIANSGCCAGSRPWSACSRSRLRVSSPISRGKARVRLPRRSPILSTSRSSGSSLRAMSSSTACPIRRGHMPGPSSTNMAMPTRSTCAMPSILRNCSRTFPSSMAPMPKSAATHRISAM